MITFRTKVRKLERMSRVVRSWKEKDEVRTETEDLGWFLLLDGSLEYLFIGFEPPSFSVGQSVRVTISAEDKTG